MDKTRPACDACGHQLAPAPLCAACARALAAAARSRLAGAQRRRDSLAVALERALERRDRAVAPAQRAFLASAAAGSAERRCARMRQAIDAAHAEARRLKARLETARARSQRLRDSDGRFIIKLPRQLVGNVPGDVTERLWEARARYLAEFARIRLPKAPPGEPPEPLGRQRWRAVAVAELVTAVYAVLQLGPLPYGLAVAAPQILTGSDGARLDPALGNQPLDAPNRRAYAMLLGALLGALGALGAANLPQLWTATDAPAMGRLLAAAVDVGRPSLPREPPLALLKALLSQRETLLESQGSLEWVNASAAPPLTSALDYARVAHLERLLGACGVTLQTHTPRPASGLKASGRRRRRSTVIPAPASSDATFGPAAGWKPRRLSDLAPTLSASGPTPPSPPRLLTRILSYGGSLVQGSSSGSLENAQDDTEWTMLDNA